MAGVGVLHSKLCGEFCKQNITTNVGGEGGFYKKESSPPYVPRLHDKSKLKNTDRAVGVLCYLDFYNKTSLFVP